MEAPTAYDKLIELADSSTQPQIIYGGENPNAINIRIERAQSTNGASRNVNLTQGHLTIYDYGGGMYGLKLVFECNSTENTSDICCFTFQPTDVRIKDTLQVPMVCAISGSRWTVQSCQLVFPKYELGNGGLFFSVPAKTFNETLYAQFYRPKGTFLIKKIEVEDAGTDEVLQ